MTAALDHNRFIRQVAFDAARAQLGNFPRPLGADGPHVGDPECAQPEPAMFIAAESYATDDVVGSIDLAHEATPAADDLRNALQILGPTNESLIGDAVKKLIESALAKIEAAR